MMGRFLLFIVMLVSLAACSTSAGEKVPETTPGNANGAGMAESQKELPKVTVTGTVRRVGNEPFTEIVITDKEGISWAVNKDDSAVLVPFLQQEITVDGLGETKQMMLANGVKLRDKYIIHDIKIIE